MTSNINPNNIDGAYPVAGQDNNSQGFRDNFTNTKTNFAYAAAEITDLQNKAVLKAALTGGTLNNNMNGALLNNAQLQNMSGTVVALGTISGSFTVDYSAGPYQTLTTAAPVSLDFSNFTAAGTADYVVLQITVSDVSHTLQLPTAVGYSDSATSEIGIQGLDIITNTITFSATGTYLYSFTTADGGTTVYINDLSQSRSGFTGNVSVIGNLSVTGTIVGNIEINNIESIVGNVTAGNLLTGGLVSATANITGGNLLTGGLVSAAGNVTGANVYSNNLMSAAGNVIGANVTTTGSVRATGNITTAGALLTANLSLSGNVLSVLNVSGNIAGSNLLTPGDVAATGNATAGNISTIGIVSAVGNVTSSSVRASGVVSATGNVTGGNIITAGQITATGNIVGGNINPVTTFTLPVFANATVRDSSITSPTAGMMVYVTGTGMQVRGATSWNTVAGTGT